MSKILIIDDDPSIVELIKINLELIGHETITATDGIKGVALCFQELPDLVILDVMMPEVDGFTVAKRIRNNKATENIPILMLTALGMLNDKVKGFNSGVDDYLVKPFELEELKVRVRALLKRGNSILPSIAIPETLVSGDFVLEPENFTAIVNGNSAKLTPIEFEILNLLVQSAGQTVSSQKLLKEVWGYSPEDDVETIRVHIRHLRTKIDKVANGKKYIETIYGGGYKLNSKGYK